MKNTCICVAGMHRSGTSAVARALATAGVQFGADLLPAADQNPEGFWEHREVVQIHEGLLSALGSSWDDIRPLPHLWWEDPRVINFQERLTAILNRDFGQASLWGIKDPRICRLLPLWKKILTQLSSHAVFVIPFRHPAEVARSLQKRDDFTAAKSGFLWLDHNLSAETWSRGHTRVFVNFDSFIRAPSPILQRILITAGCSWDDVCNDTSAELNGIVLPRLRHHTIYDHNWESAFGVRGPLLAQSYRALKICGERSQESAQAIFDALQKQKDEIVAGMDEIATSHLADLQKRISSLEKAIDATPRGHLSALLRRFDLLSKIGRA
jgi:hypothetical protein